MTVKPPPASPQDRTGQAMKAVVQDMVKSSLTQFGVIPKETLPQPQAQSITVNPESPQTVDLLEGEISNSEQEGTDSGTTELDQLILTAHSFTSASPSVTRAPLWKFAEEIPSGS